MGFPAAVSLLALLFASPVGDKARLSDLDVTLDGSRVNVSFRVLDAVDAGLLERIDTGLADGFDIQLRLVKRRPLWFDDTIGSSTLQVVAMYNAVTREYLVNHKQDGKLTGSKVVRDANELTAAMTSFEKIHAFTIDERFQNRRVRLRARAVFGSKSFLLVIPTRIATDWVESQRFRLPAPQN